MTFWNIFWLFLTIVIWSPCMQEYPFSFLAQFSSAKRFVLVPHQMLDSLINLNQRLSYRNENRNLILIDKTARSGSTLLCQMFSRIPETRVISEPAVLVHATLLYYSHFGTIANYTFLEKFSRILGNVCTSQSHQKPSYDEFKKLIMNITKLIYKPNDLINEKMVVLKLSTHASNLVSIMKEALPCINAVMITRHIQPSVESFEKMMLYWTPMVTKHSQIKQTSGRGLHKFNCSTLFYLFSHCKNYFLT